MTHRSASSRSVSYRSVSYRSGACRPAVNRLVAYWLVAYRSVAYWLVPYRSVACPSEGMKSRPILGDKQKKRGLTWILTSSTDPCFRTTGRCSLRDTSARTCRSCRTKSPLHSPAFQTNRPQQQFHIYTSRGNERRNNTQARANAICARMQHVRTWVGLTHTSHGSGSVVYTSREMTDLKTQTRANAIPGMQQNTRVCIHVNG